MDPDDEEVVDSWEDLEDNDTLDRDIEKLQAEYKASEKAEQERKRVATLQLSENSAESMYKPQLKILKRQANERDADKNNRQTEVKSLEERQTEYMKARERILGSARPEQYEYSDDEESEEQSAPKGKITIQKR